MTVGIILGRSHQGHGLFHGFGRVHIDQQFTQFLVQVVGLGRVMRIEQVGHHGLLAGIGLSHPGEGKFDGTHEVELLGLRQYCIINTGERLDERVLE